ncbi:MAG: glycosyltransferase family 39 protein [Actinomycetota bacterium]|nr:glycosyltransferase family 39 protein [Actinomycetota bacterium]
MAGPCALAAALTLFQLSTRSLWLDEGASVSIATQHGSALWSAIGHDGGNMLAYYLLLHVLIGLFGDAAAVIRLPSVIATLATVAIVGLLGRRLFDNRVAFAAGLLSAVSLPLVFWGQDARGYAPLIMVVAGSFLAFMAIVETPEDRSPSRLALVAYGASIVLAAYLGFAGALVVPAQLLMLLWRRRRARVVLGAVAVAAVGCVPLLLLAANRGSSQLFWVPRPNAKGIGQMLRWLTSAGMPPNFRATATGTLALVVSVAGLLAAAGLILARLRRAGRAPESASGPAERARPAPEREAWAGALLLSWLAIPMLLSLAESASGQPILLYRNSVICMPAVALLLAWALLRTRLPMALGWLGVGALLALRAVPLIASYGIAPEDWKAAEQHVVAGARPGDCVVFYPLDGRMPFDFYVRARGDGLRAPTPVSPATPWARVRPFVEDYATPGSGQLQRIESGCPGLWLVVSHQGQRHGPPGSRTNYVRYRALQATLQEAYPHHGTRVFGYASQVRVEQLRR